MFELPKWIFVFLTIISIILIVMVFANLIFYTVLSVFGLKKPARDYEIVDAKNRFLFLIPANDESNVIGETIEGLLSLNYSKCMYDIVCIADNCKDNTADIANSYGIEVFVNQSGRGEPKGKPHAIGAYLSCNRDKLDMYDYIAFIDADNYLHSNFLTEVNSMLEKYPDLTVVQGYLGIKNVFSSITASGYAAVYYITNRAVQYAKTILGWNASIGGTGFVISTDYIKNYGWNPRSYTEDFELQVELSIQGKKSRWNHWAITYDEKPNNFLSSHRQRKRWAQGHWFVGIMQTPSQLMSILKSKNIQMFLNRTETLFYSYSMVRPVAFFLIGIFSLIDSRFLEYFPNLFSLLPFWLMLEIFNFIVIPLVYLIQEGSNEFKQKQYLWEKVLFMFRLLLAFLWNSLTYAIVQIIGFFTWFFPQNAWNKTVHSMHADEHIHKS